MTSQTALYIVPTPLGNLADMSLRAIDVLKSVDLIAAEDTRHSSKLLSHHGIHTQLISYHDHGGDAQVKRIVNALENDQSVALISDAGTPLISDPGYRLVTEVCNAGFSVVPIPGACALITALSASGLPSDRFSFEGFPPAKQQARLRMYESLVEDERTLIFYESTHRIEDSLADMVLAFGAGRPAVLARELSKTFETFLRDTLQGIADTLNNDANQKKGEFVLLVQGKAKGETDTLDPEAQRILSVLLGDGLPVKQASALAAKITGEKKNKLYQWALDQKG